MLLLDILANADNNVQKASEKLTSIGYEKRDTTAPKQTNRNREEIVLKERIEAENTPPRQSRIKSNEEKQKSELITMTRNCTELNKFEIIIHFKFSLKVKNQLKARYKDVAGRIITMALESVDYSEEKACKILEIVMQDDKGIKREIKQEIKGDESIENESVPTMGFRNQNESVPNAIYNNNIDERYLKVHSVVVY